MADHVTPTTEAPPSKIGLVIYPGFSVLDTFGPLECLNVLSMRQELHLYMIAETLEPVSNVGTYKFPVASTFDQKVMPTHTFETAPEDIEVLIVPGGLGARKGPHFNVEPVTEFVKARYPKLRYLISICTGSNFLVWAGILDGRKATTNKSFYHIDTVIGPKVNWVKRARWVEDGNIWTSSGISAGIDCTLAWIQRVYGSTMEDQEIRTHIADVLEYVAITDPENDPFADRYNL